MAQSHALGGDRRRKAVAVDQLEHRGLAMKHERADSARSLQKWSAPPGPARESQRPTRLGAVPRIVVATEVDGITKGGRDLVRIRVTADPGDEVSLEDDRAGRPVETCSLGQPERAPSFGHDASTVQSRCHGRGEIELISLCP